MSASVQDRRQTELCGIAMLGQHYSALAQERGRVRLELLCLIEHLWALADHESQWCASLLSEDGVQPRDGSSLVSQTSAFLAPEDFTALAQCLGWFDTTDGAMQALLRDLPADTVSASEHWELFPEPVLNAFSTLDTEPTLDLDTVNQAYKRRMKLLHPDARVGVDLDDVERAAAEAIVRGLSDARELIKAHFQNLRRRSSEPGNDPVASNGSAQSDNGGHLNARVRTLGQQIQHTLEAANEIVKEAEERIQGARARHSADVGAINSHAAPVRQETDRLLAAARAHVAAQGAEQSFADVSPSIPPVVADVSEAIAAVASLRTLVNDQVLKTAKPKDGWRPNSDEGTWVLGIVAVVMGAIGATVGDLLGFVAGFAAVYGPVMWWLHHDSMSTLRQLSIAVEHHARKALGIIDQYTTSMISRTDRALQAAEQQFRVDIARLDESFNREAAVLHTGIASLWRDGECACAEWQSLAWSEWRPASAPVLTSRFATVKANSGNLEEYLSGDLNFVLPALAPFSEGHSLLFETSGSGKELATDAIHSLLARLLATVPAAKLRFTFIDPIALGNSVAAFMPLADHDESLVASRAWSEPHHIEQRLGDLSEHMETVIQKYLRTEFKTIHDYNEAANEVAEPYRFIVIFDFPANFTETAARRLVSIARNGARCGVYALIVRDKALALPYGFSLDELRRTVSVVEVPDNKPEATPNWTDADFRGWRLRLDAAAPQQILTGVISAVGARVKDGMRVEVPYRKLLSLAGLGNNTWWTATTAQSIRVPLGPTGARKLQYLVLGEGMGHHALIVGRPGSGKSNLMHVIITTLALTYSPDEIRLYLIDFKKGVEFKGYADAKLPHAEVIAIESEREFGLSVVERLDLELKRRGDLFRSAGAANIAEYRERTRRQIPRVLLLVDEFQEFFTQDDQIARQTTLILDRLVRQGRAFGIHIILGSQTLAGSYNLSRSTLDQMAVRIAMQCSEADSRLILSDDNPAARLLSRPGEAIYNASAGLIEGNNLFQVARVGEHDSSEYLGLVAEIARNSGESLRTPIVFEGNDLAHLVDCRKLRDLLDAADWPNQRAVELLLGDPIAIKEPVTARMRRQSGSHLLILSRDEAEGMGLCTASIVSILAQQRPSDAQVFIADFALADGDWAERAETIKRLFPHQVHVLKRQRDVAETVKTLADEVRRRGDVGAERRSLFLVIQGMHRVRVLRGDDESFSYDDDNSTPAEHFASVLRGGPEVGVHVIAWCDTYANASRVADRRLMPHFGLRTGGAMSADDSMNVFDDTAASRIDKPHRSFFFEEERPGQLEKFRPYSMPPLEWLETAARELCSRP
ncbi:MAG: FtsK/SpoIIIE domain-containing protein [Vicinamibacterales bacterium]